MRYTNPRLLYFTLHHHRRRHRCRYRSGGSAYGISLNRFVWLEVNYQLSQIHQTQPKIIN